VVVLAGDIDLGTKGVEWALEVFSNVPVIYVVGNHEFYRGELPRVTGEILDRARGTNVHVLENREFRYRGVRFLGCTLWTDFALFGTNRRLGAMRAAAQGMNDYHQIRASLHGYRRLRPEDTAVLHHESVRWLEARVREPFDGPTVVVTHHAPSFRSVPLRFRSDLISAAFASNLDDLVQRSGAAYWIHGHTHDTFDYSIGHTRVVCNPLGYPHEQGRTQLHGTPAFQPVLLLNVAHAAERA
jgi:predicted phosphodiesterase